MIILEFASLVTTRRLVPRLYAGVSTVAEIDPHAIRRVERRELLAAATIVALQHCCTIGPVNDPRVRFEIPLHPRPRLEAAAHRRAYRRRRRERLTQWPCEVLCPALTA